jgi:hypothetical protein
MLGAANLVFACRKVIAQRIPEAFYIRFQGTPKLGADFYREVIARNAVA